MTILALYIGKLTYFGLRLIGKRGAALPGLIVEKLDKNFLDKKLRQLPEGVIVVTGTNGKTTTTKMLTHVLAGEKRVLTNPTGSNFTRGVVASIIQNSKITGSLPFDIAVIELDEAYAVKFIKQHRPRAVLILNIMRDQMDRFGEIDSTAKMLAKVVSSSREFSVLNADDPRVAKLVENTKKPVVFFGVSPELRTIFKNDDELHDKNIVVNKSTQLLVELHSIFKNQTQYFVDGKKLTLELSSSGAHNAQNAAAVLAVAQQLGLDITKVSERLVEVKPAFGRGEVISFEDRTIILQLVKNPGGFRHALLSGKHHNPKITAIAINDDYADGRDVSWLWDVDFNGMLKGEVYTSGARAYDMALRLKYDDIETKIINQNLKETLGLILKKLESNDTALIYTTYTAMLALRKLMSEKTKVDTI